MIHGKKPCTLRNTAIFLMINAHLNVIEYSEKISFDYALSGPFDNLFFA
ncbi:MAG: hypothetical protein K2J08_02600 [Ruminococcus sp.]|nr:hypothetical protein [Ruminococcus sp.]